MDASRSDPEPSNAAPQQLGWWQAIGGLTATERLAALGALICAAATVLPWYEAPVGGLVKTGLGSFGFAMAAQLITAGAAIALLIQAGRGRHPPKPLHEGALLAAAGFWEGGIVVFLIFDRPQFELAGFNQDYALSYGIFVALGGAALLAMAGLRTRHVERVRERRN